MKTIITYILFVFFSAFTFAQNNLLDTSDWTAGTGSSGIFGRYGSIHENVRELGIGPFSQTEQVLLWKGINDPTTQENAGGWTTGHINVNSNMKYRLTVWINEIDPTTHRYFGFSAYAADGSILSSQRVNSSTVTQNPYFGASSPTRGEWYLFVGFINPAGSNVSTVEGKIYNTSGDEVGTLSEYIFPISTATIRVKTNNKNNTGVVGEMHYYSPTLYEVNTQMPTITTLLGQSSDSNTGGPSLWSQSGNDIYYNQGNVGIGTNSPDEKVHIEGSILLDAYNQGTEKGIFFREGFSNVNKYNLSILTNDNGGSSPDALSINAFDGVYFNTGSNDKNTRMLINSSGNVGIGTTDIGTWKLAVNGKIRAKEIKVETNWADYVFLKDYKLPTLAEVAKHIEENGHLINIPSASEVEENGIEVGEMNKLLLEKIEELTLYILQQNATNKVLEERLSKLENNK